MVIDRPFPSPDEGCHQALQEEEATTAHVCDPCGDTEMAEGSLWVTLALGYSLLGNSPTQADSQASSGQ